MPSKAFGGYAPLYQLLSSVGDGSGTTNWISNHAPGVAKIVPPAGERYIVERMLVHIEDAGPLSSDNYGGLGGALGNGILVKLYDSSGEIADLTAGLAIDSNSEWSRVCHDVAILAFGVGNDTVNVRWTFTKGGQPLQLDGDRGDYLAVEMNDNFTGLVDHYFMVQGFKMIKGIDYY